MPRIPPKVPYKVGDLVKVRFKVDPPIDKCEGERMWVRVIRVLATGVVGILDNDPVVRTDLKSGDVVEFSHDSVLDVWRDDA